METRRLRLRIGGWALVVVCAGALIYIIAGWGLNDPVLVALLGVFILRGRENVYDYLLPVVGGLALLRAIQEYLVDGVTP